MTREQILARRQAIIAERRAIHTAAGDGDFTAEQTTAWEALDTEDADLEARLAELDAAAEAEKRAQRVRDSRARFGGQIKPGGAEIRYDVPAGSTPAQTAGLIMAANEKRVASIDPQRAPAARSVYEQNFEMIVRRCSRDEMWARQILARSHPDYTTAFGKLVMGNGHLLTPDEQRAAIAVGTNTAGGYMVPTHLDPTLILTNSGTSGSIRPLARVVQLTNGANVWHGITTAGVTASWDAELTEVSDDTPAVASASVTVFAGKSLVQASIEAFEDIANLPEDATMLLLDAQDRLQEAAYAAGSGTGQPKGLFTAIAAASGRQVVSTTAAAIGLVDLNAMYLKVGVRWRNRASWLMNPLYSTAIKALGTAISASYSGDLREPTTPRILNRPVVESDDAPTTQTTTALDSEVLFGDFSNYVIVDKPGSTAIELIPHLFNTANNLPDGRRAWYMHFRNGGNSVNDNAFALLQDKTSA